ncbi:hypothetical protein Mapa_006824 [Marchantia paleacea]|nr:hypothetical protein Mapa_006824 [Marchantia paleacea]
MGRKCDDREKVCCTTPAMVNARLLTANSRAATSHLVPCCLPVYNFVSFRFLDMGLVNPLRLGLDLLGSTARQVRTWRPGGGNTCRHGKTIRLSTIHDSVNSKSASRFAHSATYSYT